MSIFSYFRDIVLAIAALWTALTAHRGLKTWRKQLQGTAKYNLAREVLTSTYKLRTIIKQILTPIDVWIDESEKEKHSKDEAQRKLRQSAYDEKLKTLFDELPTFEALMVQAEVLFGSDIRIKLEELQTEAIRAMLLAKKDVEEPRHIFEALFEEWKNPSKVYVVISEIESKMRQHLSEAKHLQEKVLPKILR
jgi:hypothetical protein